MYTMKFVVKKVNNLYIKDKFWIDVISERYREIYELN